MISLKVNTKSLRFADSKKVNVKIISVFSTDYTLIE